MLLCKKTKQKTNPVYLSTICVHLFPEQSEKKDLIVCNFPVM